MIYLVKMNSAGRDTGHYSLDPYDGTYTLKYYKKHADAARRCSGLADEPKIGLWRRWRIFVAMYVLSGQLRVFVNGHTYYWPGPFQVTRKKTCFGGRRFEISLEGQVCEEIIYRSKDHVGFPGVDSVDIFARIEASTQTLGSLARSIYWWGALAAGRNEITDEFLAEVEAYVAGVEKRGKL